MFFKLCRFVLHIPITDLMIFFFFLEHLNSTYMEYHSLSYVHITTDISNQSIIFKLYSFL